MVKPLHVVDDQDHWARVRSVTHKLEGGQRDAKRSGSSSPLTPNVASIARRCASDRCSASPDDGVQEPVQPGEWRAQPQIRPNRGEDTAAPGAQAHSGALQQRRLADARLAADEQRSADIGKAIDKFVEAFSLGFASDEVSNCLCPSRGAHEPGIGNVRYPSVANCLAHDA